MSNLGGLEVPDEPGTTLSGRTQKFERDLFERVVSTVVQAELAFATVEIADLDPMWIPLGTALLSLLKGFVAKFVGRPGSASLDPAV